MIKRLKKVIGGLISIAMAAAPDSNLEGVADDAPNPEAYYTSREAMQLV